MSVLIEKISAVLEKQAALGKLATLPIPRGFDEQALDDLPDADKVTYRFQSRGGNLRITLFREPVERFDWQSYVRVVEPDDPTLWDRTGRWGREFLEEFNVWISREGDGAYIAVAYDPAKCAAVYLHMTGQTEESACRMVRRMIDAMQVNEAARSAWFQCIDMRQRSGEETLRIHKRNSREALVANGWPVPEDRDAYLDRTRWVDDELVVSGVVMQLESQGADWIYKRLIWRGFGEGLSLDSSARLRLEWRVDMRTSAWDEATEKRFRQQRDLLRYRVELLMRLPAAARIRRWENEPLTWEDQDGIWIAYSADRQRGYALPFRDVQHVWPFEDGWARFTRGMQAWHDGGPRGEDWSEFRGTYHAVRADGLILEDSFDTMVELNLTLRELPGVGR